ncbi:MAG: flagellar hook-associated protein FlgL [Candidatus Eisenbacteria bacterium]
MATNRISTRSIYQNLLNTTVSAQDKLNTLQRQIADGKKLRTPADDPVGTHLDLRAREHLSANEQYQKGLEQGLNHLEATDSLLTQVEDSIATARSIQVSAANDGMAPEDRAAMAEQLDQMVRQMVEFGNQQFAGTRLFGGLKSEQAPFAIQETANGKVSQVLKTSGASAKEEPVVRRVDRDVLLSIHAKASDVFGEGQELFKAYIGLRDALAKNDVDAIRQQGDKLDQAQNRVLAAHGVVGTLIQRAESLRTALDRDSQSHEAEKSRLEDLDVAAAVFEMSQQQTALQAALQAGSRILTLSLLDYMQ